MGPQLPAGHYYGKVLKRQAFGNLVFTETEHARGVVPRHSHLNPYICLVQQGSYTEDYNGRTRACGPLTLAFHPPAEIHAEHIHTAGVQSFNIEVAASWLSRLGPPREILDRAADFQGGPLVAIALRIHREFQRMDEASPLALEGLFLELLAEAWRCRRPASGHRPPRWAERVREILHARFVEHLTLTSLAEAVGVHPVYLASEFRRHYGQSIGAYVRRLRVAYACRQLTNTDVPLAEIALTAGFADQSHFSRTFKSQIGRTPLAYRRDSRLS
jgi:AraC family transcriptional regulator